MKRFIIDFIIAFFIIIGIFGLSGNNDDNIDIFVFLIDNL